MQAENVGANAVGAPAGNGVSGQQAVWRGFLGRCPRCAKGRMFRAFLKVADHCPHCGEALHHQRADDFPPYCVILLTGHIIVPLILAVETHFAPAYWVHLALWLPSTLALALGLLQPVKGAIVGLQWSMGMDGFAPAKKARERGPGALAPAAGTASVE